MSFNRKFKLIAGCSVLMSVASVSAGPVYQPPGANLTYGDVTHGQRVQSASSNPAAAAADLARGEGRGTRGTVISGAAGLEYGNVQDLFDFYDKVTGAYEPSDPGSGGGPGQDPDDKPDGGIDLGDILDMLDPEFREALDAIANEVVAQTALLALIAAEGYGKAWVSADAPFLLGTEHFGGAWTFGVNWSGSAKAYGLTEAIDFDRDAAREAIADWVNTQIVDRPQQLPISDHIILTPRPGLNALFFAIDNDSSLLTKSTRTTELNLGYSRQAWAGNAGRLFLGAEARLYLMQLSRLSVRFGDITDSEELFDAIRDADFSTDEEIGIDLGALWVADNYQLGVQVTSVNEPDFVFPDVNLAPYRNPNSIRFLLRDKKYKTQDRSWSAHLGYDADPATDPMGDRFQWLTMSMGFTTDSWWMPGARIGYRKNLAGTELAYLGVGITAFRIVNFDIASALDTVSIDGEKLPQGLMFSVGFQVDW
jgi:hypothetical protein